jgi:peptide/nickel transport system permease protein
MGGEMNLGSFLLKRALLSIFVLFGLSIMIFVVARIVPGDPARMAVGEMATPEVVEQLRQEMHLDKSIPVQYFYWLEGVFQGDFGTSLISKRPVAQDIKEYFPATLELALLSGAMMVVFAILLGYLATRYRDKWPDSLIRLSAYFGVAIPAFVAAILLLMCFGYLWPILPAVGRISAGITPPPTITGLLTIDSLVTGNFPALWDSFKHLIMPAVALSLASMLQAARITRSSMVDNLRKDYLSAERGYGIPERYVMSKYLLKPSMIPTVSIMGLSFANIISNAFLVELLFNWPGISRYGISAMLNKDLNAVSAVIITIGLVFVIANIVVDLVITYLDPRIRLGGQQGS